MKSPRMRLSGRSVVKCQQPNCIGNGTVQDTETLNRQFVKRSRSCNLCGHTWSTYELPFTLAKRLLALDKAITTANKKYLK